MASMCSLLKVRKKKKGTTPCYAQHGQLWSSSVIEDHPSDPEVVLRSLQHQSQDKDSVMKSTPNILESLQDPSELVSLVRTEWFERPEGRYSKDEWVGRQFLLYYQADKIAAHCENFTGADYTVSHDSTPSVRIKLMTTERQYRRQI